MSPVSVQRREARLIILKALAEQPNRRLTSSALTLHMNELFLMDWERAQVDQELDYLARMEAIRVIPAGSVRIAALTTHGARHLSQAIVIPEVMRPTDPMVLPEAMGADMAKGRGRLSSIELLSVEAADDVLWANQELYARARPIADIFVEFNERLATKGIEPISRTAFYNRSSRVSDAQRRMKEKREMFAGLADEFSAEDIDQNNVMLGDFIMTLISELLDDAAGRKTPKDAMELARAYSSVISGQKISTERRVKLQAELASKTEEAVREVGKAQGWSTDTVDAALSKILGVEIKRK